MNRLAYILVAFLAILGLPLLSAQTYEQMLRRNFWNDSRNITGIRQDNVSKSYAELTAGYEGGDYRPTWQAEQAWSAGARTASIRHFKNISYKGGFSFNQWEGYGMCGSMFIAPGYYPIDVLEFTPGRKTLQTYALDGGFSYDLNSTWRIGVMADFASANIAKRKDLRHTNWKLDFTIAPGVMWHVGDLAVGASYIYRKNGETIEAEQVGIAESSYYAFFDKGLMYGVYQVWTGSGVHLDEAGVNRLPVKEFSNGLAAQLQYNGVFAELEYARTQGSVGEKEYIWFRFPGNQADLRLGYRAKETDGEHLARLDIMWKSQTTYETVLEKITQNGVTTVVDHGSNMIQQRNIFSLRPSYKYIHSVVEFGAGADVNIQNSLTSQMYPYIYKQSLTRASLYMEMLAHYGRLDLGVKGIYTGGRVSEDSRLVSDDSGVQTQPYRLQEWYERQMEYDTAKRIRAEVLLRYNFSKGTYLRLDAATVKKLGKADGVPPTYLDARLAVGLNF